MCVYIIGDKLIVRNIKGADTVKDICLQGSCPMGITGTKNSRRTVDLWIGSIIGIELAENPAFQRVPSQKSYVAYALSFHLVQPSF